MSSATTALERLAIVVASIALSVGLIALLSGFFAGRDPAGVGGGTLVAAVRYPDQGHSHLAPGELRPVYDSEPPTSGPHIPLPIGRDETALSDDQLLEALELGDVVLAYGSRRPNPALLALQRAVAGPFTPRLAAAGQAVVLDRRPGTSGVIALAWTRMLHVASAADPRLREFTGQWLGRQASGGSR
ncbi:MAG TPA: DUF3105 domain-containing protein [Solirubrobacteraceae bacterium]|nr:DUF3105 domain-containing protein [Solirubrobacteraceae bacterium]